MHTLTKTWRYYRIWSVNCLDLISECFLVMSSHHMFCYIYVDRVLASFLRFPTSSQLLTQKNTPKNMYRFSMMNLLYIKPHTEKRHTLSIHLWNVVIFFPFSIEAFWVKCIVLDLSVLRWNISLWIPGSRSKKWPLQIKTWPCHGHGSFEAWSDVQKSTTLQKSKIDTKNCPVLRDLPFPNHRFGYPC